jgi:SIR2-like domain
MGSKLEAADPYIFYAYEFRRFCILSKLIVIIGYSFSDLHINKMLVQALRAADDRRLFVVARCAKNEITQKKTELSQRLGVASDRILPHQG